MGRGIWVTKPHVSTGTGKLTHQLDLSSTTLSAWALTPLVEPGKGLEVPGIAEGLQLLFGATCKEADKVQSVQLELQGTVELQQTLPMGDSPSGKKEARLVGARKGAVAEPGPERRDPKECVKPLRLGWRHVKHIWVK